MTAPIIFAALDRPATPEELENASALIADGFLDGQPIPARYGQLWQRAAEQERAYMGRPRFIAWTLIVRAARRGRRGPRAATATHATHGVIIAGKARS
ncbi:MULTISPECIES: hypothetical protein [unclassified Microbacterium]|uniref:hypothetical protein n=1 Tax=unclassified Microbacterium TaxID=2609290 RepID=UPI00301A506C